MSNISDFLKTEKKNRIIVAGPATRNFVVPDGTTEVEIHVFGGGANSQCCHAGGGGGGYATATVNVGAGDTLTLTAGGPQGTSSVTIPTQSPTSPISATGGSCRAGGTGTVSLAPPQPTNSCFTASGGTGGFGCFSGNVCGSGGGGASAGSPYGNGKAGGCGGPGIYNGGAGGSSLLSQGSRAGCAPGPGGLGLYDPSWFSIKNDNVAGAGGNGAHYVVPTAGSPTYGQSGGLFAGGGASVKCGSSASGVEGGNGGIGGGGAGGTACTSSTPGVGGFKSGGAGLVVIYY